MPQKTNLNISPYYDDFDKAKNFYKILFKPGKPVQARELSGLQSILQNQVENFGKHIFKEGSMVIPGGIEVDKSYFSCKINPSHLGVDVSIYLDSLISKNNGKGTRVRGQKSGIVATIKNYVLPPNEGVEEPTIFVKYNKSGTESQSVAFPDGEILILEESLTYGNTTINTGETVLTLSLQGASATGSGFGISEGVYFVRGTFVDVPTSFIILDPYNPKPSYRVGLEVIEEVVNANDDSSLYDNAKGFTNFAAPGADRFKISVKLTKKALTDNNDTSFVELYRIREGEEKKVQDTTVYSEIKKYFAKRTFDESGNYAVEPFRVNLQNSLNDEIESNGLYTENQLTDQGNKPSEDTLCVKLSPGKAYVKGFDVYLPGTTVLDVPKPRDVKNVNSASIPFSMGSLLRVNNVFGTPYINLGGTAGSNVIELYNQRRDNSTIVNGDAAGTGLKIGEARVYSFGVTDASYSGASTEFDLHLYDIQTYTTLEVSNIDTTQVKGARVRGLSSGAIGYLAETPNTSGSNELNVSETTGTFIVGEQLIYNEKITDVKSSIIEIHAYNVFDIKSVYQDSNSISGSGLVSDFLADSVLYDRILPGFSPSDQLSVTGGALSNTATVAGRRFAGKVGLTTDSVISYNSNDFADPVFNRVTNISNDGKTLTLDGVDDVADVCKGNIITTGSTSGAFRVKIPLITNIRDASLFTRLPRKNISNLNSSNSNLVITTQVTGESVSNNTLSITSNKALDASIGITSAFFEPFDAEKYSITYNNGDVESLSSDKVTVSNNGNNIAFTGLSQNSSCTVNVTLKKIGVTSKSKNYVRSKQLEITRTAGISTNGNLTQSNFYGLRIEDQEISLNNPDVCKVIAVYESKTTSKPVFDKLKFVSGLSLDTASIIGEKIVGEESRAIGQIVERGEDNIDFVYLNANRFTVGEKVTFKESSISSNLQDIVNGNYVDRTDNYILDKGHTRQISDYSRIVRKDKSAIPAKRLLVIFDQYQVPAGNKGDLFSVNSFTSDRYTNDIPLIGRERATDILDLRPRVKEFNPATTTGSPFAFCNREFEEDKSFIITPNESSIVGYSFYLPRIDKLVINEFEQVKLIKGQSSETPVPPTEVGNSMEVAQISLPPYLYDPVKGPSIRMFDNRRFTMRDIGALEKRIENLEEMTSLSALELDTKSLEVKDANGLNRFKSGFAVNNFKNRSFINFNRDGGSRCDIDTINRELISAVDFWSMRAELALNPSINTASADLNSNLQLLDTNCRKTGDLITLDYSEIDWIEQPQATRVENVNPFNVITFAGGVVLDPPSDNWTRTIYIDNFRTESSGARWVETANIISNTTTSEVDVNVVNNTIHADQDEFEGHHEERVTTTTTTTTQRIERSFTNTLEGPSREFDYVESVKVDSQVDPFMRSRNVAFNVSGLKPATRHFHYLDSASPDIVPKLSEIEMISGSFNIFENARIELDSLSDDPVIGYVRIQRPNHKFGDTTRPDVGAGLGSPSVLVEEYSVDPYDTTRPAPSASYSATSKLLNIDISALANDEQYFGYFVKGATVIGETSGAVAKITNIDLISDNWGDLIGTFFFRNANAVPKPPVLFRSGTKTFKVTAAAEGTVQLPGATALSSDASGVFTGTGTILTQTTDTVGVRIPPAPPQRANDVTVSVNVNSSSDTEFFEAPYRDPLAQSFRVDETGAFLTSFDLFFASKDPNTKVFIELRHVELGTPTRFLVQDYAQVALNPSQVNISDDASAATTIKFPSPVYLEPNREYAIVILSPASDLYEMWVARMGEKTVKSTILPDVEDVVVSKQYIGGSLFKSQNGTIWTPSQYEDLCFKLRKASFVSSGTATFYNSPINPGNLNTQKLPDNPIRSLPRKLKVGVTGTDCTNTNLPIGKKVSQVDITGQVDLNDDAVITGIIEGQGAPISSGGSTTIVNKGSGYPGTGDINDVPLKSLTGSGSGAIATITVGTVDGVDGAISAINITTLGTGYQVGDVLTVNNADDDDITSGAGFKCSVSAINSQFDSIFLTDVQGSQFTTGRNLVKYDSNNAPNPTGKLAQASVVSSTINGELNSGDVFEVTQYNHAHHGANNKVVIKNVKPDTLKVKTTSALTSDTTSVEIDNTTPFTNFNGISTDRGSALIGSEIVSYVVGTGKLTIVRGQVGTTPVSHNIGSDIQTYEAGGISLVGINTTFDVTSFDDNLDTYFLKVDMASLAPQRTNDTLLCFTNEKAIGGKNVQISQNHQFSSISPQFNVITPGKSTNVNSLIRTVSGTSAGGNEVSFIDQGFSPTTLNETTFFPTPRLVASVKNESERLQNLPKNKSLTLDVNMTSNDSNLSPVLDVKNSIFILGRNKINNPIGEDNYATDERVKSLRNDPHGSVFVSKPVTLKNPATSLKVLVAASREPEADFRVFYRLFSFDSSEVSQTYRPFPGFKNLTDTTGDGFGNQIVDNSLNDGRPDAQVAANGFNEFSEYQFSVDDLEEFNGFVIKIVMTSTNESVPVRLKDFRTIALA